MSGQNRQHSIGVRGSNVKPTAAQTSPETTGQVAGIIRLIICTLLHTALRGLVVYDPTRRTKLATRLKQMAELDYYCC
ncbi:MAG TPA: hypothetical protein VKZ76_01075 [Edaphocola sp.]|nr:hypothetical protein [Edaphocola sp.]